MFVVPMYVNHVSLGNIRLCWHSHNGKEESANSYVDKEVSLGPCMGNTAFPVVSHRTGFYPLRQIEGQVPLLLYKRLLFFVFFFLRVVQG